MRKYEVVYIVHPEKSDEQVTQIAEEIKVFIEKEGGGVDHVEQWGKKKLAYAVKKNRYGHYTLLHINGLPDIVGKLERTLKLNESVIKYAAFTHHPLSALKPTQMDSFHSYHREEG